MDPDKIAGSVVQRVNTVAGAIGTPQPLTSIAPIVEGNRTCYSGMLYTTGYAAPKCGTITRRDLPIFLYGSNHVGGTIPDPNTGLPVHLIEVTVTSIA